MELCQTEMKTPPSRKPVCVSVPSCYMDRLPSGDIEVRARCPISAHPDSVWPPFLVKPKELPAIVAFLSDCITFNHEH